MSEPPSGQLPPDVIVYKTIYGVNIYYSEMQQYYFFWYQNKLFSDFNYPEWAEFQLRGMVENGWLPDFMPPPNLTIAPRYIYRNVPVFQLGYTTTDGLSFRSDVFWHKSDEYKQKGNTGREFYNLENIIDSILAGLPPPPPQELPPTPTPTPTPVDVPLPNAWSWLVGLFQPFLDAINDIKLALSGIVSGIASAISGIGSIIGTAISGLGVAISNIGANIIKEFTDSLSGIFSKLQEESQNHVTSNLPDIVGHSSPAKQAIDQQLEGMAHEYIDKAINAVDPKNYTKSVISPEEAALQLRNLGAAIVGANVGIWTAHFFAESITLGQLESVGDLAQIVLSNSGVNAIAERAFMIPIEKSVLIPAEYKYNAEYTPNIPNYSDLINMLVKEKITQEEFNKNFAYLGFNETWAKRIWDAHFIPPTLTDFLTAWRRGIITEAQLDQGMIRVDLDPEFKNIFDTRKYQDPPLNMIRFMFETGAIEPQEVAPLVHLLGYRPEHEAAIVNYITEFQARLWRRRYLVSLSQGYEKGLYSSDQLKAAVIEAEYTGEVADYIIRNADVRKNIAATKTEVVKVKLLTEGDLKKLFMRGKIDDSNLRTELLGRGYQLSDIDLLVGMLKEDKVIEESGGPKIALTETQLLQAYNYGELTRDQVLTELMLRGMTQREAEILLNTFDKKRAVG